MARRTIEADPFRDSRERFPAILRRAVLLALGRPQTLSHLELLWFPLPASGENPIAEPVDEAVLPGSEGSVRLPFQQTSRRIFPAKNAVGDGAHRVSP